MTEKNRLLTFLVGLIAVVACLHLAGFYFELYWRVTWYDRIVHILGSIWAISAAFFIAKLYRVRFPNFSSMISVGIVASFAIGIAWELFELKNGITVLTDRGYGLDTLGDIVSDGVGGILASWYIARNWGMITWKQH